MKKGFTLVELLGVIVILGVLALIAFPIVDNSLKNSREKAYERTIDNIEEAARMYGTDNKLSELAYEEQISLKELKEAGYIKNQDTINPITKEELTGCIIYSWNEEKSQFVYTFSENCIETTPRKCFETSPTSVITDFSINYDKCVENFGSWELTQEQLSSLCNGNEINNYPYSIAYVADWELEDLGVIFNATRQIGTSIYDYDTNCGVDVTIPYRIDGVPVLEISYEAFTSSNLRIVDLSRAKDLVSIGTASFANNKIQSVNFSNLSKLTSVGYGGFASNNLSSIDLSDLVSLKEIDGVAFSSNSISSVIFPENLVVIGGQSFGYNEFRTITIPDNITVIGREAFQSNNLNSVTIPSSVTYIGSEAFSYNNLSSITIPSSVESIGRGAFYKNRYSNYNLNTISNQTGLSFDWGSIITDNWSTEYNFVTGTVVNSYGNVTVTN